MFFLANNIVLYTYKFVKKVDLILCVFKHNYKKKGKKKPSTSLLLHSSLKSVRCDSKVKGLFPTLSQ